MDVSKAFEDAAENDKRECPNCATWAWNVKIDDNNNLNMLKRFGHLASLS